MCQDLPMSQRGASQLALLCRLIRSWTLRHKLGKYVLKLLLGKNSEIDIFACSFCTEPGCMAIGLLLTHLKTASLLSLVLWDLGIQGILVNRSR